MKNIKTKVKAKFIGCRTYEVKIKQGKQKIRKIIYIPRFTTSKKFTRELFKLEEEIAISDYTVSAYRIYIALLKASMEVDQSIPYFLTY